MSCSAFSLRNSTVSPPLLLFFALLCPSLDFLFCVFPNVSIAVLCISSAFTLSPSILSLFSPSSRSCSSADSFHGNNLFYSLMLFSFHRAYTTFLPFLGLFSFNLCTKTPIWSQTERLSRKKKTRIFNAV